MFYDTPKKGSNFLQQLVKKRGHKCECCGNSEWLKMPIKLEVHHRDGDKRNCTEENLQLLCPNCHSFTDNYGIKNLHNSFISDEQILATIPTKKNIRQVLTQLGMSDAGANYNRIKQLLIDNADVHFQAEEKQVCQICGFPISQDAIYCIHCAQQNRRVVERPSKDELKTMIRNETFVSIGRKYGVSDNAIRKWCDFYGLPKKKSEIKKYTNEQWELL